MPDYVGVRRKGEVDLVWVGDCCSQVEDGPFDGPVVFPTESEAHDAFAYGPGDGEVEVPFADHFEVVPLFVLEGDRPVPEEVVKRLTEGLGRYHWNNDFNQFCRHLGFEARTDYAQAKWRAFLELVTALNQFDLANLTKLVNGCSAEQQPVATGNRAPY